MTVLSGIAPATDQEFGRMIAVNREAHALIRAGNIDRFRRQLTAARASLLADPLAAITASMDGAPEADRDAIADPRRQEVFAVAMREALRQGVGGWLDEAMAIDGEWRDIEFSAARSSVTWWHAAADANAPLSAARRLLKQLPSARLRLFGDEEGHAAGYDQEGKFLDELLSRDGRAGGAAA